MKIAQPLRKTGDALRRRKGIALVTVLTIMALTTVLILTFFSLATSEHRASKTYSQGLQAQQVAEQAVNMVIAQIREATTVGDEKAWASQPGAIRVWDDTGGLSAIHKLYSDDVMKTFDEEEMSLDFVDLEGWSDRPAHFVDLNEPVIRGQKVYYPIAHPAAANKPDWPKPLGNDQDGVEGFSYNSDQTKFLEDQGTELHETAATVAEAENGHLPMPVRWIYQLADGTLGVLADSPSGGGQEAYSFRPISGGGTPSEKNPMVARFAFWVDDETSKLNINTHAGGLAWDIPKAGGAMDMNMARYQPAQKEWQRYPGHPATTHLIPALAPGVQDIVNDRDAMEMLFDVVPRVVGGGSESGTRKIDTHDPEEANGLVPDKEPLFPTLDDMIMDSDREPHEFPDANGDPIPDDQLSEYLERSKFFITATSRAPETNLFNKPRVAIWPIYNARYDTGEYEDYLTTFDRLIHYTASMGDSSGGGYPRSEYIFKRENADSTTFDFDAIPRNEELYRYLEELMNRPIPGFGGSFTGKYGGKQSRQILTEIFDYIRSTNLHDDTIYGEDFDAAYTSANTGDHLTYTNPRRDRNKVMGHKGHGQVVPIRIDDTKGFGRFYSLGGLGIQVISCAEPGDARMPANLGATSYRGRNDVAPPPTDPGNANFDRRNVVYSNFPPHPVGFEKPDDPGNPPSDYESTEPQWLEDLREGNGARSQRLYHAAFEPSNWNWQLAFLDLNYHNLVVGEYTTGVAGDPARYKYRRSSLSEGAFTSGVTRLNNNEQLVQGALLFNLFTPSVGWSSINPDMEIEIEIGDSSQMRFTTSQGGAGEVSYPSSGVPFIGFEAPPESRWIFSTNWVDTAWGGRRYGGLMPFEYMFAVHGRVSKEVFDNIDETWAGRYPSDNQYPSNYYYYSPELYNFDASGSNWSFRHRRSLGTVGGRSRYSRLDRGYYLVEDALAEVPWDIGGQPSEIANAYRYDLVTVPFKISGASVISNTSPPVFNPGEVQFTGGDVTFRFYHGGERSEASYPNGGGSYGVEGDELIQEIEVEVPEFEWYYNPSSDGLRERRPLIFDRASSATQQQADLGGYFNEFEELSKESFSFFERNSFSADPGNPFSFERNKINKEVTRGEGRHTPVGRMAQINVHHRPSPIAPTDVVRSVEIRHGDARMVAARADITGGEIFQPHRYYDSEDHPLAHSFTNAVGADQYYGSSSEKEYLIRPNLPGGDDPYRNRSPLPFAVDQSQDVQLYGDFDNGAGIMIDGPYINKPDEGNTHSLETKYMQEIGGQWASRREYGEFPYFNRPWRHESGGPAYFSPNRIVSGPGMFGSLPTGTTLEEPWRTLLFRPPGTGSDPGYMAHPGGENPPDHLIMDLFWMPIVEPYAISEPLSTAGKVNLNYQMVPFLHVERNTALRGVFRSEYILCVPNEWVKSYKHNKGRGRGYHWRDNPYGGELQGKRLRSVIVDYNVDGEDNDTFDQFRERFGEGTDMFRSSSEICDIHLVREEVTDRLDLGNQGAIDSYRPTVGQMESGEYWADHAVVGDNARERPYTNIQNRLTTKSNTFKVHYRAQVIKQARRESDSGYGEWRPQTDTVQAEYRGSSIVERFVDPNDEKIPDFATEPTETLDDHYRYRVVNPSRFAP